MKSIVLPTLLYLALTFSASAQEHYTNVDDDFIGLGGYDPVSYFTQDRPTKGKMEFITSYNGATYRFNSQEHLDLFTGEPEKYAPAYGGYCAYAMGKGYLADVDPETYKIKDGKLLVFYNKFLVNTLKRWNNDEDNLYSSAEKNWESKVAFED